jgi:transmembrane sensor
MANDDRDPRREFPGFQGMELPVLRRHVAGKSPMTERRAVEAWAAEAADRRRYLDVLRRLYDRADPRERKGSEIAWRRILVRMESSKGDMLPAYRPLTDEPAVRVHVGQQRRAYRARVSGGAFSRRHPQWALTLSMAATILLAAAGIRALGSTTPAAVPARRAMRVIATSRGQRAQIQLDDGTQVTLGVDSRLRLASDFGTGARDVYLDGTAYFRVAHDARIPFEVHTANAVTRDVGTRFVVRAYPGDGVTTVVVTEGSVALESPDAPPARSAVLTRDELGVLADGRPSVSVATVDPARYTAWLRGRLVFRDTPLRDVARELQRWYDVDVELGDSTLADVPLSASFGVETLREAIGTITTVLPLRAVQRGQVVTLFRR